MCTYLYKVAIPIAVHGVCVGGSRKMPADPWQVKVPIYATAPNIPTSREDIHNTLSQKDEAGVITTPILTEEGLCL